MGPHLASTPRIALRTWLDTILTWSTLLLTGSSLGSRALSTCASPWAPAGLFQRSSLAMSALRGWSGLRLTWRTQSSRRRQLSSLSSTGALLSSPMHPGHPAPLHPHARHGHGEVHGAH